VGWRARQQHAPSAATHPSCAPRRGSIHATVPLAAVRQRVRLLRTPARLAVLLQLLQLLLGVVEHSTAAAAMVVAVGVQWGRWRCYEAVKGGGSHGHYTAPVLSQLPGVPAKR
jgi:hypothetical protein